MKRFIKKFLVVAVITLFPALLAFTVSQQNVSFADLKAKLQSLYRSDPSFSQEEVKTGDDQIKVEKNSKPASVFNYNFLFNLVYKFTYEQVGQ